MPSVTFCNKGLIVLEAITTMGVNAKENDNPIGFFGTGLKYAIAALLRTGQRITIYRGLEKFDFTVEDREIRGKSFGFISMNGKELGFTTHLGAKWEQWQIFRELYSNTLDEGGDMFLGINMAPKEGETHVVVWGDAFYTAAEDKDKIFLSSSPLFVSYDKTVQVHQGKSDYIYYRGVRAGTPEHPTLYTYNIIGACELTEDRTIKYEHYPSFYITRAIAQSTDEKFLERSLLSQGSYESKLDFSTITIGEHETFPKTVLRLCSEGHLVTMNSSALVLAERWANQKAEFKEVLLTPYESQEIADALSFLREIGFDVTEQIVVTHNLGQDIYGLARNGKIYLSKTTLDKGGNWLAGTILEEHLHITRGFIDESRSFQNFLFDLAIRYAREASSLRKASS